MDINEMDRIVDQSKPYFKELGWDEENCSLGFIWMTMTVTALYAYQIPFMAKRFPEVLRALANILDLIQQKKQEEKKGK